MVNHLIREYPCSSPTTLCLHSVCLKGQVHHQMISCAALSSWKELEVFAQLIIKKLDSETDNTKVGATRKSPRISCRKSQWMYIQNTYDKIPQIMAASFPLLGIRSESPASFASITAQPSS